MKVAVLDPGAPLPENEREAERAVRGEGVVERVRSWVVEAVRARGRNREEARYVPLRDIGE